MVEAVTNGGIAPFTTLKYTTKTGENITATKQDGIVTLVNDKKEVKQMPLDTFIREELPNNVKSIEPPTPVPTKESSVADNKVEQATTNKVVAQNTEIGQKLDTVA